MDQNTGIKNQLRLRCIVAKEEMAEHLQSAMDEAQQSANDYGAPKDRYDSYRAQLLRKRDMLAQQMAVVQEELRYLKQLKGDKLSTLVEPGALVILPGQKLYISVGLGKIELDGSSYYAVSPLVPLVAAMKGLKKGDRFQFRGTATEILDIL